MPEERTRVIRRGVKPNLRRLLLGASARFGQCLLACSARGTHLGQAALQRSHCRTLLRKRCFQLGTLQKEQAETEGRGEGGEWA